jgi:hypothetical protein
MLRVNPFTRAREVTALSLQQDDGDAILPVLKEIEFSTLRYTEEDYEHRAVEALAAFEPFVSARERAGHL